MDFFEALKKRARREYKRGYSNLQYTIEPTSAIDATIEALKEMMVGEAIGGKLEHVVSWDQTFIRTKSDDFYEDGLIGTDGEEVVVMVFKKP